jgi:hypothetical protein
MVYNQGCPEGVLGGVAPLENFVGKNMKGGPREISAEVYPPPPGKFRPERISKGKFSPPSNFGNFQLASPGVR